jgi:hypothetical protein
MPSTTHVLRVPGARLPDSAEGTFIAIQHDDTLLVECDGIRLHCRRAFSCLIAPEPGDTVLVHGAATARPYVLAILERGADSLAARFSVDGDLVIEATRDLRVVATRELDLQGTNALRVEGAQIAVTAEHADVVTRRARFSADETSVRSNVLRVIGQALENIVERVVQISKTSYRTVEATDHLRAGQIDHEAEAYVRMHGNHVLVTANRLSKIDADQIHLG